MDYYNFTTFLDGRFFNCCVTKNYTDTDTNWFWNVIFFRKFLKNRIVCLVIGGVGAVIKKVSNIHNSHTASQQLQVHWDERERGDRLNKNEWILYTKLVDDELRRWWCCKSEMTLNYTTHLKSTHQNSYAFNTLFFY